MAPRQYGLAKSISDAEARENSGDVAGALTLYEAALKTAPNDPALHIHIAQAAYKLKKADRGIQAIERLMALDFPNRDTGALLRLKGQFELMRTAVADPKAKAAPGQEYENSLGMKFVPVPGTDALFCIWETRVKDYSAYASANPDVDGSWRNVKYKEVAVSDGPTHPVVNVSWEDAHSFCAWLTKKEQEEGRLTEEQRYRLPTDLEWSAAVGLNNENGDTPKERNMKIKDVYPWGSEWPPPSRAGNFADASFKAPGGNEIPGYSDGYATSSPVGSFLANRHGLYDLAGNVWEWCDDWYDHEEKFRMLRGGSWFGVNASDLLSSRRRHDTPDNHHNYFGFRVVLVVASAR